jgi:hypothetical protein
MDVKEVFEEIHGGNAMIVNVVVGKIDAGDRDTGNR